jgi:uncharacterized protein
MTLPHLDQRLATRAVGVPQPVMYQRWSDLLFLHWRWDPADLASRLPAGLSLDLHQGEAWLGVVPFFMERIRPRFLPPVPGLSWFQELNVRTYVHDGQGRPGVWFFSLDCDQPLAVSVARRFFHLPYFDAEMKAARSQSIDYTCQRFGQSVGSRVVYSLGSATRLAEPGSLDFFLTERYLLFSETSSGLCMGQVEHRPYPLAEATVTHYDTRPLEWNGFPTPQNPPDHIIGSHGVSVRVGPLSRLTS